MMPGMPMGGGLTPGAPMPPAVEQGMLMSFRYLDDKGQPIPVGGGAAAGDAGAGPGPAADPAAATADAPPLDMAQFGAAYKRLPVRMLLRMDIRKLPLLIAACANEPLRVEVQEVRINPSDASSMGGGMMGGMMGGMGGSSYGEGGRSRGPGSYSMGGGAMGGGAATNLFPDRTGIQVFSARPFESTVVVQGIIYIFNKPNLKNLAPAAEQPVAAAN